MNITDKIEQVMKKKEDMDEVFIQLINSSSFKTLANNLCLSKIEDIPEFIFAGIGKNWYICQKVVKTFLSMGLKAQALDCGHALHGDLGMLTGQSAKVLFFISRSGTTKELVDVAKVVQHLKKTTNFYNVTTVSFFLNKNIPNHELYDMMIVPDNLDILDKVCEFDERNLVPSFSIDVTQLALDLLGVMIYESHPLLVERYKWNHLAGNNGKKLGCESLLSEMTR